MARRVGAVATALYASAAYLGGREAAPLADHDWLAPDESLAHLASARWLRSNVPADRIVVAGNSLLLLHAAAAAGLGVAPLPCYLGDSDPALRRLGPPIAEMAASLWIITHPSLRRVARVRAFLDFAAAHLRKHRAAFAGESG